MSHNMLHNTNIIQNLIQKIQVWKKIRSNLNLKRNFNLLILVHDKKLEKYNKPILKKYLEMKSDIQTLKLGIMFN